MKNVAKKNFWWVHVSEFFRYRTEAWSHKTQPIRGLEGSPLPWAPRRDVTNLRPIRRWEGTSLRWTVTSFQKSTLEWSEFLESNHGTHGTLLITDYWEYWGYLSIDYLGLLRLWEFLSRHLRWFGVVYTPCFGSVIIMHYTGYHGWHGILSLIT